MIGDIGDMGVWTEAAYSDYQDNQYDNTLEAAIGVDYKFDNDLYLVGQVYYKEKRLKLEPKMKIINFYLSKPIFKFHFIEITGLYELENKTYFLEPQFNYSLNNFIKLKVGGSIIGNKENKFGLELIPTLNQEDRVYVGLDVIF